MSDENQFIDQLIQHLKKTIHLNKEEEELVISSLEIKNLKKKDFLLQPGDFSQDMRYIAKGSARVFYLDEKGQENTIQLGIEEWWINDLYSYLTGKPSKMHIQAVENTTIIQLNKSKLEVLFEKIPHLSNFFRIKMQNAYVALQEKTIENQSMDAYEKYLKFRKDYRVLEQRFPQYIIASFLGMTPEFLSYLRKKNS